MPHTKGQVMHSKPVDCGQCSLWAAVWRPVVDILPENPVNSLDFRVSRQDVHIVASVKMPAPYGSRICKCCRFFL